MIYNKLVQYSIRYRSERLCADVRQTQSLTVKDVVNQSDTTTLAVAAMPNAPIPTNVFWALAYLPAVSIDAVSMRNVYQNNIVANVYVPPVILAMRSSNVRQVYIMFFVYFYCSRIEINYVFVLVQFQDIQTLRQLNAMPIPIVPTIACAATTDA